MCRMDDLFLLLMQELQSALIIGLPQCQLQHLQQRAEAIPTPQYIPRLTREKWYV
jgi:hypothetical protein